MFTQSLLTAEIARSRQTEVLRLAERHHRLFRPALTSTFRPTHRQAARAARNNATADALPPCAVLPLPATTARTSPDEARVA